MQAAQLLDAATPPAFTLVDLPIPTPRPNEVLIKVHAVGVTPTELSWYPTSHTKDGSRRLRAIPGHEFSGVVHAFGAGVTGLLIGEQVYGMNDWFAEGAAAEFCLTTPDAIARRPCRQSYEESATVPISALTAWQGLFARAKLQAGERVLVHGGAGAVGLFVIQLAKLHGADVIATASARNLDYVRSLGADEVIDYKATRFEEAVGPVDVLFDTVGGETLRRSWSLLKPDGRAVTIVEDHALTTDPRAKDAFFLVEPNTEQLADIAILLDGGSLRSFVGAVVPLSDVAQAYAGAIPREHGRGKVVLSLQPSAGRH